jgi:CubicO group peptidase (beta-lactamase class C family)
LEGAIDGHVEPEFSRLAEKFKDNFDHLGEIGAGLAVYLDGELVVDLCGGSRDPSGDQPWDDATLACCYLGSAGVLSVLANHLIDRGLLDEEAFVAEYWPEFARNGKENVTVRDVLSHSAGLPVISSPVDLEGLRTRWPLAAAIAEEAPAWPPGQQHGYHCLTFGYLIAEIARRATGMEIGDLLSTCLAGPLGLDMHIGLSAQEHHRVAAPIFPALPEDPATRQAMEALAGPDTLLGRALTSPRPAIHSPTLLADPAYWELEIPSALVFSNARSLAKLYAACIGEVDGTRLLSPDQLARASCAASSGPDRVLIYPTSFGLGFMLPAPFSLYALPGSVGHHGGGGAVVFADPARRMAFAYVTNRIGAAVNGDPRSRRLIDEAYACIGERSPSEVLARH